MKKTPILAAIILLLISLTAAEEWMSFTTADGLAHDICRCVAVDHDGNVWVGHGDAFSGEGGVSMWDGETWTTYYSWTTDFGLRSNYINDIAVDQDNNIWFGTGTVLFDGGLTKFDGENWTSYALDTLVEEWIFWVSDIEIDGNGNVWCATTRGAVEYDGEIWTRYTTDDGLPADEISNLEIDQYNVKWFTCHSGLISYDGFLFHVYDTSDGLYHLQTEDVYAKDSLLIVSYVMGGYSELLLSSWVYYDSSFGLDGTTPKILIDHNWAYFFATFSDGRGVYQRLERTDTLFIHLTTADGLLSNTVYDLAVDDMNNKYFATREGLNIYNEDSIVWSIAENKDVQNIEKIEVFPNPFSHEVRLWSNSEQVYYIFDIKGRLIKTLIGGSVIWKPKDLSSGVYFVKTSILEKQVIKKIFYMR